MEINLLRGGFVLKKIFVMITSVFLLLATAVPAFADYSVDRVTEKVIENPVITDQEVLFERAVNGISDLENEELAPKGEAYILNNEDGISKDVKVYSTTQLVKEETFKDGNINREYVTTSFAVIKESDLKNSDEITTQGHVDDGKWDPYTATARAYSSYNWERFNDSFNAEHVAMSGTVSGGWELRTGTTIKNKAVDIVQNGPSSWGGYHGNQIAPYSIPDSTFSFSKSVPSSWQPVKADDTATVVGTHQKCTITRGGSSWSFPFKNYLYGLRD